jgi:protein-S-isoprenylcysteine O-methyltransferase Ste14
MTTEPELPRPVIFPPLLFVGLALLGIAAGLVHPWHLGLPRGARWLGAALIVVATALAAWAAATLAGAKTTLNPSGTSSALVIRGPFRFTRNPMYLSLAVTMAGIALFADSAWVALLWPVAVAVADVGIIQREEARLDSWFGESYRAYRARVRRWI